jgi:hypothetical protein
MDFFTALAAKSLVLKEVYSKIESNTLLEGKADLVNGTIPISQIPPAAIEKLVAVADDTARFALTTNTVQLGDTVKVTSTDKMYLVVDVNSLDSEAGYQVYVAGRAIAAITDQNGNTIDTTYATITNTGDITNLTTTDKTSLVAAINELNSTVGSINSVLEEVL